MKIMGLPNWLHWTAWFVKTFIFMFLTATLIVVLLTFKWYPNTDFTVFTHADPTLILFFFVFYICSSITFAFAVSVFFSKGKFSSIENWSDDACCFFLANTATTITGLVYFVSYAPFMFMQENYDTLSLSQKLLACLGSNSAMGFGLQVILMYEGTGEGE